MAADTRSAPPLLPAPLLPAPLLHHCYTSTDPPPPMATRLPLWHRLLVVLIILGASAAILVWGYVLNVGTLVVHLQAGDTLRVDGEALPPDGRVRAGNRRIDVTRPHYADYGEVVRVTRSAVTEVTPQLVFQPYVKPVQRPVPTQLLPVALRASNEREQPGALIRYPDSMLPTLGLDARTDRVTSLVLSADWSRAWVALASGEESVRTMDGTVLWSGRSVGRAFAGQRFLAVVRSDAGATLRALGDDGKLSTIGALDGSGTFTLVPSPDGARTLVIDDERGTASLLGESGRERLELEQAVLDARWSPDGTHLLLQERLKGAAAAVRLATYDLETRTEQLLNVRSTVALTAFGETPTELYTIERLATSNTTKDEVLRQLSDPRVKELADQLEQKLMDFQDFQDALPADLRVDASLVRIDLATGERTELRVANLTLTSEVRRLEEGPDPGTLLVLQPDQLQTIILRDSTPAR